MQMPVLFQVRLKKKWISILVKLKFYGNLEPIYRGPWIVNKDLSDEQFDLIQSALLRISNYKDAEIIFKDLGTKGFIKGFDSDYDNIREVRKLMPELITAKIIIYIFHFHI